VHKSGSIWYHTVPYSSDCITIVMLLHDVHTGPSHTEYSTGNGITADTDATAASREEQIAASKEHRSASATAEISEIDRCVAPF
jgi:hypothetical protein